jgi:hypothetical protein
MQSYASCALAVLFVIGGCCVEKPPAASAPGTKPSAISADSDMKTRPFMFDEASLPRGYPAPGPVGEILIKQYPAARIAINRGGDQGSMFMPLFNHIKKHDIAMSSPVEISWSDPQTQPADAKPQAMAFVYRQPDLGSTGMDGKVEVVDVPPQTFLSVGIRGSYNREHLVEGVQKLRGWLAEHSAEFKQAGPPRYLGYNSPFVPWFLRFGEVQLPIVPAAVAR